MFLFFLLFLLLQFPLLEHQGKKKPRSRQTANSCLLLLVICPGTGNIVSGCAWRQGSKGHAPSKVQILALGRSLSRTGRAALRAGLGFQTSPVAGQDGGPSPAPELLPRTKRHEPGCASARMDAPGQHRPAINALNAPGACCSLISSWATAACILVSAHSNHLRRPSPTRQGRLQFSTIAPSRARSHLICTLGFDKPILHLP